MYKRTYGWVQNPSDFEKLKKTVQIFDNASAQYAQLRDSLVSELIAFPEERNSLLSKLRAGQEQFTYRELVGRSRNAAGRSPKRRGDAVADGLIQITIVPQSANTAGKRWTDDWTSDGFLRWALSLNFVVHDRNTDICSITELGREFSRTELGSLEERALLQQAFLAYPPASRVLQILNEAQGPVTKFYIGANLGFKGERGFTSYDEKLMKEWFNSSGLAEQKKIRSDVEGTADKYARMISGWLRKVGYVSVESVKVSTKNGAITGFQEFTITAAGIHALRRSQGSSNNTAIPKYLTWEFLAVAGVNENNRDYVRTRRAYVLKLLQETRSKSVLMRKLQDLGFTDSEKVIVNDIEGLNSIGVRIQKRGKELYLLDELSPFDIPNLPVNNSLWNSSLENLKNEIREKTDLPPQYYELVDIAYDGSRSRDFEVLTISLFKNVYKFEAKLLGGGLKPDGVIFSPLNNYGVIIDTKAYKKGYGKNIAQQDAMTRYINDNKERSPERNKTEWWEAFRLADVDTRYYFMWISSFFTSGFRDQLEATYRDTGVTGAALNVEQLLYGADLVASGRISKHDLEDSINNTEIFWQDGSWFVLDSLEERDRRKNLSSRDENFS